MEEFGTGAGLAALGFWLFVGLAVVAGAWDSIRKREAQHETLRRIVESGQRVDEHLAERLLSNTTESKSLARDLRIGGLVLGCIAPGLSVMGWIMSITLAPELFTILLAVSILILFISAGLMLAAYMVSRQADRSPQQPRG
ncbi:MAG: hypothetical protein ACFHXK_02540 [bacterium]